MTLGPRQIVRCPKEPTVIVKENKPAVDGMRGSMSLCDEHLKSLVEQKGGTFANTTAIENRK
jgi:hypothetical protein